MLALVFCMTTRRATCEVEKTGWFPAYAVLGDDVVIANCVVVPAVQGYALEFRGPGSGCFDPCGSGSLEFAKSVSIVLLEFTAGKFIFLLV